MMKIFLCIGLLLVVSFIVVIIMMAITEAKEETRDIEEASKKK